MLDFLHQDKDPETGKVTIERFAAADDFGNILLKVTTAPNPRKDRWNMGIYKGPRLFAGSKVSIDYVTSPKSGANTNCYID